MKVSDDEMNQVGVLYNSALRSLGVVVPSGNVKLVFFFKTFENAFVGHSLFIRQYLCLREVDAIIRAPASTKGHAARPVVNRRKLMTRHQLL